MEGEYKMFIDSLSERNKSKNAIKGFHPCIESSLFKGNYPLFKRTSYLILLLLTNASSLLIKIIHFQGKLFLIKANSSSFKIVK